MILHPRKTTGTLRLPAGKTVEELNRITGSIESAAKVPPGSYIFSPNIDRADKSDYVKSDPRILRKPQAWPGPSAPGASIAEPIVPGIYQDGTPCRYKIAGHHLQLMGMSGAGKSEGGAWNHLGEAVTRHDYAGFGFDISKGHQFLGPLESALHKLITDPEEFREFMPRVHQCRIDRSEYMADHHFTKWEEGCGLSFLEFWWEECPDLIEALGDGELFENWMSDIKNYRSAGGRWDLSLQRSDFTQIPTLARGQIAKMCFGVDSSADADFGLSTVQKDRDCRPELWSTRQPGMCFLDAATIPDAYVAMPLRMWHWGEGQEATARMLAHAGQYPAALRPLDPVTAAALGMQPAGICPAAGPASRPAGHCPGPGGG